MRFLVELALLLAKLDFLSTSVSESDWCTFVKAILRSPYYVALLPREAFILLFPRSSDASSALAADVSASGALGMFHLTDELLWLVQAYSGHFSQLLFHDTNSSQSNSSVYSHYSSISHLLFAIFSRSCCNIFDSCFNLKFLYFFWLYIFFFITVAILYIFCVTAFLVHPLIRRVMQVELVFLLCLFFFDVTLSGQPALRAQGRLPRVALKFQAAAYKDRWWDAAIFSFSTLLISACCYNVHAVLACFVFSAAGHSFVNIALWS